MHDHELDGFTRAQLLTTDENVLGGIVLRLKGRDNLVVPLLDEEH